MILEGKGARAALVTTAGFRHVLTIGRQDIPRRANLYAWVKPARPVSASCVLEVDERIGPGGVVLRALDEASVRAAAAECRRLQVQAVAVCLLHSFANSAHEERVAEILREELPGVAVTASVDVLPVIREYERSLATVLNATVMPGVSTYVSRLEERLRDAQVQRAAPADAVEWRRRRRADDPPGAGAHRAVRSGGRRGRRPRGRGRMRDRDLITVDIGGTSADICLIKGGQIGLTHRGHVGEWPLPLPMVDMVTIGAGGGSIAQVTDGALTVGPASAGADARAGLLRPRRRRADGHRRACRARPPAGGAARRAHGARRRRRRAPRSRTRVAEPLGLSLEDAARGILAIVDNNMVGALRVVSVERGHDPRDFTLAPFGGAGPLHGCALAALLGVTRVLIPPAPGVLCADGLLAADLKAEFSRTLPKAGPVAMDAVEPIFAELARQADAWLAAEGVAANGPRHAPRRADALSRAGRRDRRGLGGDARRRVEADFVAAHQALYGFTLDSVIELVTVRIEATGRMPEPRPPTLARGSGATPVERRAVHLAGGVAEVPVYDRATLGAGDRFAGPAIITQLDATTFVAPGMERRSPCRAARCC